jgi:predicted RNA-binding Zn-ribbon protein involved in translation (DUF1610 family)
MNGTTRTHEEAMNAIEIDCPWCAAAATIETAATRTGAATFVCPDCLVRVEMAPDPTAPAIALAA